MKLNSWYSTSLLSSFIKFLMLRKWMKSTWNISMIPNDKYATSTTTMQMISAVTSSIERWHRSNNNLHQQFQSPLFTQMPGHMRDDWHISPPSYVIFWKIFSSLLFPQTIFSQMYPEFYLQHVTRYLLFVLLMRSMQNWLCITHLNGFANKICNCVVSHIEKLCVSVIWCSQ